MEDSHVISDFPDYSIYKDGRVYSNRFNKYLKPALMGLKGNQYLCYTLFRNKKQYSKALHRLLATAFVPNPNNYPIVDHIDNNRLNNNLTNLRWITYSGNSLNRLVSKTKKSGLPLGVFYTGNKYVAQITIDSKNKHLGYFNTVEEAKHAYDTKHNEVMSIFDK